MLCRAEKTNKTLSLMFVLTLDSDSDSGSDSDSSSELDDLLRDDSLVVLR